MRDCFTSMNVYLQFRHVKGNRFKLIKIDINSTHKVYSSNCITYQKIARIKKGELKTRLDLKLQY